MSQRKPLPPSPRDKVGIRGIVGDWMQNHAREGGAFEAFSKFSCPVGWGIGGDLCRDCNVKD